MLHLLINTIWVLKLNFKYIPFITLAKFVGVLNQFSSNILRSFALGLIIDWVISYTKDPSHNTIYIWYSLGIFALSFLINSIGTICGNFSRNLTPFQLGYIVPESLLYEKLNTIDIATLESPQTQNLINRYQNNKDVLENISDNLITLIVIFISFVLSIIPIVHVLALPVLMVVLVSIPTLMTNQSVMKKLWDLEKDVTVSSRRSSHVVDKLTEPKSLKEVKLTDANSYLKTFFDSYTKHYFKRKLQIYRTWSLFDAIYTILTGCVLAFGIYQIITLSGQGLITIGQIAFYITALTSLGGFIDSFSAYTAQSISNSIKLNDMRELLDLKSSEITFTKKSKLSYSAPEIIFENVSFTYSRSSKKVLSNINLTLKAGEKVAIVGENGAGKTTLIKLISGLYSSYEGRILVNGIDLRNIDQDSWFNTIGVLNQDFNTYNDLSVQENIALGRIKSKINMDKVVSSAKKADAHEFIQNFPNKYDQILSERYLDGIRPSTGQWQKIAIARFFYRDAPLLILDEPTASIDSVAEANIFNRIYKFMENKSVIIISHRFSTVRNADHIIVLKDGCIIEQGSHQELIDSNQEYAFAFNLQAKGYSNG